MVFAGLWEGWRGTDGTVMRTFTIVTTSANATLRPLHERMPVVLEPPDWTAWLGETETDPTVLLRPSAADFRVWRVGKAVNNVRNDSAALLEPA
jgi:putative SOS response-associated peptidase YedK